MHRAQVNLDQLADWAILWLYQEQDLCQSETKKVLLGKSTFRPYRISMTQLLSHTFAHFTGSSYMLEANKQPNKKNLAIA